MCGLKKLASGVSRKVEKCWQNGGGGGGNGPKTISPLVTRGDLMNVTLILYNKGRFFAAIFVTGMTPLSWSVRWLYYVTRLLLTTLVSARISNHIPSRVSVGWNCLFIPKRHWLHCCSTLYNWCDYLSVLDQSQSMFVKRTHGEIASS